MTEPAEIARLRDTLRAYYERWRQLTEAEGSAISAGQWTQVESLQVAKQQLRSFIDGARHDLRAACQACGMATRGIEQEFRSLIFQLLDLEHANAEVLAAKRDRASQEKEEVGHVIQKLRELRRAYAPTRPSVWETYS
ncbi:MAG: hypothetical protein ABSA12_07225 [Verrucomicrobiia bacterium]